MKIGGALVENSVFGENMVESDGVSWVCVHDQEFLDLVSGFFLLDL